MHQPRYKVWGTAVLDEVVAAGDEAVTAALMHTLFLLAQDPMRGPDGSALRVLPYKGNEEEGNHLYTVNVAHHGLLLFSLKQDYPIIVLRRFVSF